MGTEPTKVVWIAASSEAVSEKFCGLNPDSEEGGSQISGIGHFHHSGEVD